MAGEDRPRGSDRRAIRGKPESFTFLGFAHICATRQKTGTFRVLRRTDKKMRQTLPRIEQTLKAGMHDTPAKMGAWLKRVLLGYYQYFAVPGST
jgi:hypothetical protein